MRIVKMRYVKTNKFPIFQKLFVKKEIKKNKLDMIKVISLIDYLIYTKIVDEKIIIIFFINNHRKR